MGAGPALRCHGRAAWAHAKYVFNERRDVPRRARFSCASKPPDGCATAMAVTDACRSGEPRALATGSGSRPQVSNQGRAREAFQERPSSPSGCLATFDVAVSRTLPGRFGRSPYFRHQRLQQRSLRPRGRTRRINSLYQCSVTVGAVPDRTCLWAPSLPVCGIPCVQLVASHQTG